MDQNGRPVALRGMSLSDWSSQDRQFYNARAVANLADQFRCEVLRVPLLPRNYPDQMARIRTVMDACIANGIYCIASWLVTGTIVDPAYPMSFFQELALLYGDKPNIMYEPWNEPTTTSWADIKAYHENLIAAVRLVDSDNLFLLGSRQWDQLLDEACATPVTGSANLAYTVHFYAASHKLSSFQPRIDSCLNQGFAVFASEYAGVLANGNGEFNIEEMQKWWGYLDANGIGSTAWAVSTMAETSSVFVPSASATGPWPDSQLTASGRLMFAYMMSRH